VLKLFASIAGGVAAQIIQSQDKNAIAQPPKFYPTGLLIAVVSGVAGVCFVRPTDVKAAFVAGLVGWWSAVSFINQTAPKDAGKKETEEDDEDSDDTEPATSPGDTQ
jgi:hypothetical protein